MLILPIRVNLVFPILINLRSPLQILKSCLRPCADLEVFVQGVLYNGLWRSMYKREIYFHNYS